MLGGVFFLMPVVTLAIILGKAFELAHKIVKPVADHMPPEMDYGVGSATILAIGLTILACFLAGLLARTRAARLFVGGLESAVLSKIPAYEYFKQMGSSALGLDEKSKHQVVLAEGDCGWQIGIQVEDLRNGLVAVFIPGAPDPRSGSLFFIPVEKITPVDTSIASALNCVKRFGVGSGALFQLLAKNQDAKSQNA